MSLHRPKLVLGVAALGLATVLATSAPASAGQFKSAKHHKTHKKSSTSSKGTNPNGSYCKLYKSELSSTDKTSQALEKDLEANNWPAAQKIIIAEFGQEGKLVREFEAALASAPAKVKAAGSVALQAIAPEEKAVENSTSVSQYEAAIEKTFDTPQLEAAGKTFEAYEATTCGTTVTT